MMMMMMIWGSLRANERYTGDDHECLSHFAKMSHSVHMSADRYLQVEKSADNFVVFSRKPISIRVGRGKKMTFFQKKQKNNFFSPLVSDHVVTLNCFTVRAHFFDFPIDFFWGLPLSLYADEVLCAASRAALPPHILFGWRKNRKWRNSMQVHKMLFLCNRYAPGRRIVMAVAKL